MTEASKHTLAARIRQHALCTPGSDLERHAAALDTITASMPVREMVAIWARARKYWCKLTGEPLI